MVAKTANLSELKKRALLAKQRLRMGYWQAMRDARARNIAEFGESFETEKLVVQMQKAQIERDGDLAVGSKQAITDELLYQKVCKLLSSDEVITNPIGALVDKEMFDKLDAGNRQKYILDLSKKFCELKARYYSELSLKKAME